MYTGGYGFGTGVLFMARGPVGAGAGLEAEMSVGAVVDGKGNGKGSSPTRKFISFALRYDMTQSRPLIRGEERCAK
tara:strand:- start:1427 stop:1654 length:228 start_codon:yes stop_codon:yes gene_type:complete